MVEKFVVKEVTTQVREALVDDESQVELSVPQALVMILNKLNRLEQVIVGKK